MHYLGVAEVLVVPADENALHSLSLTLQIPKHSRIDDCILGPEAEASFIRKRTFEDIPVGFEYASHLKQIRYC